MVDIILAAVGVLSWLDCMYGLALIKMITMPLKYMPQVTTIPVSAPGVPFLLLYDSDSDSRMYVLFHSPQVWQNFKRKSTKGFNVVFTWLDLVGGLLTIAQMFFIALNGGRVIFSEVLAVFTSIAATCCTCMSRETGPKCFPYA